MAILRLGYDWKGMWNALWRCEMCFEEEKDTLEQYIKRCDLLSRYRIRGDDRISNEVKSTKNIDDVTKIWK